MDQLARRIARARHALPAWRRMDLGLVQQSPLAGRAFVPYLPEAKEAVDDIGAFVRREFQTRSEK
jgi:hypothetical protein